MVNGRLSSIDEALLPITDLGFLRGWSVFETLELRRGQDPTPHLERLRGSCEAALVPGFDEALLRRELDVLVGLMPDRATVRVTLTRSGARVLTASPADLSRWHYAVRCARGRHVDDPFLPGSVKHGSRISWEVEVEAAGVDDVLRVDDNGRITEGTRSGVLAVVDGVVWSAPHDGRILSSTSVSRLLGHAEALGIPVRREGPPASGPWDGLYIASSTRSIAPVVALDGDELPGWDPVGRAIAAADDRWAGRA